LRREVFERAKTEPVSHIDVAQAIKDAANVKVEVTYRKVTLRAPYYTQHETEPATLSAPLAAVQNQPTQGQNYTAVPPPDAEIVKLSAEIAAKEPAPPVVTSQDFQMARLKALARDTEDLIRRYRGVLDRMEDVEHHFTEALKIVQKAMKRAPFTIVH
jgi:hypothetical protein